MQEKSILSSIGILIYILMSIIDKFIYQIPDYIYIPIGFIALIIIITGFIIDKKKNRKH